MPRVVLTIRVSPDAVREVDKRATAESRSRSDVLRLMLTYALRHMPLGWTPNKGDR